MINFKFEIDEESYQFCCEIVNKMVELFQISHEEAINRMNSQWGGQIIKGDDIVFHEDEEYWANAIYYTNDSYWWMTEKRDILKVKAYNPENGRYE